MLNVGFQITEGKRWQVKVPGDRAPAIELLKEAESDLIMMVEHKLESSKSKKYLGVLNNEEGTSASITETNNKREAGLKPTIEHTIYIAENIALKGIKNCIAAINYFEVQVVKSLLYNCESWIRVTDKHIKN